MQQDDGQTPASVLVTRKVVSHGKHAVSQPIAEHYGVSVQPIKAALSRLEVLGVVIQRRGGSVIVATPRAS